MTASLKRTGRGLVNGLCRVLAGVSGAGGPACDPRRTWVICGSPRSGTTWLAELAAAVEPGARLLWEPLRDPCAPLAELGLSARPFIPTGEDAPERLDKFLERVLLGQMLSAHTLRLRTQPANIRCAWGRGRWIVKLIRGNGLAAHLHERLGVPPPLIVVRHPCAVIASQLRMPHWSDHPHLDERLVSRYPVLARQRQQAGTYEEKLALTWAGDTLAALHAPEHVSLVSYEALVTDREAALAVCLAPWGVTQVDRAAGLFTRPSRTPRGSRVQDTGPERLARWTGELKDDSVKRILDLVRDCGVTLYDEDPLRIPALPASAAKTAR